MHKRYRIVGEIGVVVEIPAVISRQDVLKNTPEQWTALKNTILDNIRSLYDDALEQAARDIRNGDV